METAIQKFKNKKYGYLCDGCGKNCKIVIQTQKHNFCEACATTEGIKTEHLPLLEDME